MSEFLTTVYSTLFELAANSIRYKVLLIVLVAILFLFVLSLFFSLFTVYLRYLNDKKSRCYFRLEKKWYPLILEFINDEVEKEMVFLSVTKDENDFFIEFLYRFEERLDGVSLTKIKILAAPYLCYLEGDLNSKSAEIRAKAVIKLGNLDDGSHTDLLIEMLGDESPIVSMIVLKTLAFHKKIEAFDYAIMHLEKYSNWTRDFIAKTLSFFGSDVAEDLRFVFFNETFSRESRIIAADALVAMNDLGIHESAFRALKATDDVEMKATCIRLLFNTHNSEYIDYVRTLVIQDNFLLKLYSLKLLSKAGNISDHRIFIHLLRDEEPWIRIHAARALKATRGVDVLYEIIKTEHVGSDAARQVLSEN